MFDLPHPFGPTTTLTPGENTSRVRSGNDLKPLIVIELRCMESSARPWEGSLSDRTVFCFVALGLLPTALGAPTRRPQQPARRPFCSALPPSRSPRRRRPRRPRGGGRGEGPPRERPRRLRGRRRGQAAPEGRI